jgi:hypothetical protein
MDEPHFYEIRIQGYLAERWSDWFAGLAISNGQDNQTTLSGLLQDQAAKIEDAALRRSFLENVAAHREIVREFARTQ